MTKISPAVSHYLNRRPTPNRIHERTLIEALESSDSVIEVRANRDTIECALNNGTYVRIHAGGSKFGRVIQFRDGLVAMNRSVSERSADARARHIIELVERV